MARRFLFAGLGALFLSALVMLLRRSSTPSAAPPPSAIQAQAALPSGSLPAEPLAAPPDAGPATQEHGRVAVASVEGTAERYQPATGLWEPLTAGSKLDDASVLRTRKGTVELSIGRGIQVQVTEGSQFRLGELTDNLSKVLLEGGRMTATVGSDAVRELSVQVAGTDVVAKTREGAFSVVRSEDTGVTVASTTGHVRLSARGKTVEVSAGQLSTVPKGQPPSAVRRIPKSLFLKLARTRGAKLTRRGTIVSGRTSPGAIVSVNGVETTAHDGKFAVRVALREGTNAVRVRVKDALGRRLSRGVKGYEVDTRPPEVTGKVEW